MTSQYPKKTGWMVAVWLLVAMPCRAADLKANGLSDTSVALDTNTQSIKVQVTSSDPNTPLEFITAIVAINPGIPWLNAQQYEGPFTTPGSVTVSLTSLLSGFGAGPFEATVALVPTTGTGDAATIHVTYTLSGGSGGAGLTVSTTQVSLSYAASGPASQPASISVGGVSSYGVVASTKDGAAWLQVSDGSHSGTTLTNVTSQSLAVTVGTAASQLTSGTYQGSIALTGSDNSRQTVSVTLVVNSGTSGGTTLNPGSSIVRYQITRVGSGMYRYTYYPGGVMLHANQEIDIQFDAQLYTNLLNAVAGSGFRVVVQQPNNPSGAPGHYTAKALTDNPSLAGPMSVDFTFQGAGLPATQRYYVNQLDQQGAILTPPSPLLSGTTIDALANPATPTITSISPSQVTSEQVTMVTLDGSNYLSGLTAAVTTAAGSATVYSLSATATQVKFQVKMSATSPVPPYTATVVLTNPGGLSTSQTFLVTTAAATTPRIKADPAALHFTGTLSGSVSSGDVTVSGLSSDAGGIQFLVAISDSWLRVTPLSGSTQSKLTVFADPRGLTPADYSGKVTVTPVGGGAPVDIPVTFTVQPPPVVSMPTSDLTFATRTSSGPSPAQFLPVSGSALGLAFTVQTSNNSTWLKISPTSGTTPADLTITVDPTGLAPDTYTGTITVAGNNGAVGLSTVKVKMTVAPPLPAITRVANAASLVGGSIAPGEFIVIAGTALGPDATVMGQMDSTGQLSTQVGGVEVKVNGFKAPIDYVTAGQIRAVVPYELAGFELATVTVGYQGQVSNDFPIAVKSTVPGIFTHNQAGTGPAGWDTSFTAVTPNNPISKGSQVVLYLTGEGQTYPKGVTGQANPTAQDQLPVPILRPTVLIDGQPAESVFAGGVSGMTAGIMQLNVQIPQTARTGDLPITVTIGNSSTQAGVTVSVK